MVKHKNTKTQKLRRVGTAHQGGLCDTCSQLMQPTTTCQCGLVLCPDCNLFHDCRVGTAHQGTKT